MMKKLNDGIKVTTDTIINFTRKPEKSEITVDGQVVDMVVEAFTGENGYVIYHKKAGRFGAMLHSHAADSVEDNEELLNAKPGEIVTESFAQFKKTGLVKIMVEGDEE